VIPRLFVRLRRIRRWFNRSERAVNWLGLSRDQGQSHEPGLVMIQIDGLGREQFERALAKGRLPFLRRLMKREGYSLKSLYAGVPSTTPAVQAELFYGKKSALPAFSYLDPADSSVVRLYDPPAAKRLEQTLALEADGLTKGGAAYGNIFGGGAEEAETHFCVSALGWSELRRGLNPLTYLLLILMNFMSVLRVLALIVAELGLSIVDFVKGVRSGQDLRSEAKFILARVGVCIGLRELIVIGACMDIARGLPIIHLNLAGFDEQAHRRGPNSAFAHWVLKGVDHAIRRVWIDAKKAPARDYRVWIYSDHGQETTIPYIALVGRKIQTVVAELMQEVIGVDATHQDAAEWHEKWHEQLQPSLSYRSGTLSPKSWRERIAADFPADFHRPGNTRVIALGPVGFVYAPRRLSFAEKSALAAALTEHHKIPCVFAFDDAHQLFAWISGRRLTLPEQRAVLIGQAHPFAEQVMDDTLAMCRHPGAGDLILSGWRDGMLPLSFANENGSHGGFGPHETHGIALLDSRRELPLREYEHVRASDLRLAALQLLNRDEEHEREQPLADPPTAPQGRLKLRVMTYNVHSCIGMDGRCSPGRIARMIGRLDPDLVALQELDNGREISGYVHQVREIAQLLNMHFVYFPVLREGQDEYGNAFLSRWKLDLVANAELPRHQHREPRGVLWAALEVGRVKVQILNTHLGLLAAERKQQIDALMSDEWAGRALQNGPTIVLGDFNATENGYAWKRVTQQLRDVQQTVPGWKPRKTWFSTHPSLRLDHIFVSPGIGVDAVHRPIGTDYQMASDHLPLVADLVLRVQQQTPALRLVAGQGAGAVRISCPAGRTRRPQK
jgi:endonuclease/exonuclease/phosphatase family metal-dependent hydrolase